MEVRIGHNEGAEGGEDGAGMELWEGSMDEEGAEGGGIGQGYT